MAKKEFNSSVRGERVLRDLGILRAFERGDHRVLAGPEYVEVKPPGRRLRMLFVRDPEHGIEVGYALLVDGEWQTVETEPFTLRSFGYYERRVKRLGVFVRNEPLTALLPESPEAD